MGAWLIKFLMKKKKIEIRWQELLLGMLVIGFFNLIPWVGWILGFVMSMFALGILVQILFDKINFEKKLNRIHKKIID